MPGIIAFRFFTVTFFILTIGIEAFYRMNLATFKKHTQMDKYIKSWVICIDMSFAMYKDGCFSATATYSGIERSVFLYILNSKLPYCR